LHHLVGVDDFTGEVVQLSPEEVALDDVNYLPPLHPSNYSILPTEILNLFATGIVSRIRRQSANQILMRVLASNSGIIDEVLPIF
jgi:hypothetical protein